jgi:acyl carrier protein
MDIRTTILDEINILLKEQNHAPLTSISDGTVLLETGLDSLAFAVLVARLEEKLDYDPFVQMTQAVYPRTFKEFLDIYVKYKPENVA